MQFLLATNVLLMALYYDNLCNQKDSKSTVVRKEKQYDRLYRINKSHAKCNTKNRL